MNKETEMDGTPITETPKAELIAILENPRTPYVARESVLREIARRAPKPTFYPEGPFADDTSY